MFMRFFILCCQSIWYSNSLATGEGGPEGRSTRNSRVLSGFFSHFLFLTLLGI